MSAWKLTLSRIHSLGGTATVKQIDDGSISGLSNALKALETYGLVQTNRSLGHHRTPEKAVYVLTENGWLLCEGRVRFGRLRGPRGRRFTATWLRSFPGAIPFQTTAQLSLPF